MSDSTFLSVKDLTVEYVMHSATIHAVNGVSFELKKGSTLGLVGETGAGKTTIAKSILRILPDPPAKVVGGQILLEGRDILTMPEQEMLNIRGDKIAMIFQDPMTALNPVMTVGDQIIEGLALHNRGAKHDELVESASVMLETVGIPRERMVEYPHQFSGGMKQRVVIAMALACNPELLLADEPTTALDVTIQAQVLQLIRELKIKFNTSMLLITHDLGIVANTCDEVAVIYAGRIVESGSKRDIFKDTRHPYTKGLFNSLPKLDVHEERLTSIPGMPPDPTRLLEGCAFHPRCPIATKLCAEQAPAMQEVAPGHLCSCHYAKSEV